MSATVYLFPNYPRAVLPKNELAREKALQVELYFDGLYFREPGSNESRKEPLVFGKLRYCSIARLIEAVAAAECPECGKPICRDAYHAMEMAAGWVSNCPRCEIKMRLVDAEVGGLKLEQLTV